jgi:hypothetical protein
MRYKPSIVGGYLADKLLPSLAAQHMRESYELEGLGATFSARLCSRKSVPSGGLVLTAVGCESLHNAMRSRLSTRLRSGWTRRSVIAILSDMHRTLAADKRSRLFRDQAFRVCEQYAIPDSLPDSLDGHTIVYDEMSSNDCAFWIEYAKNNWELKA